jgi:uncharacterized coiled-coil protein SlyX
MLYCCEKCQKEFLKKSNYLTHINRKKSCVYEEYEHEKVLKRTCGYCDDIFSSPQAVKTHMPTCKKKPNEMDELKQIIVQLNDKLNKQNDKLDKQNDKLDEINNKVDKVDKPNITNVNIQQNIIITPFGKEDLSFLTLKDYKKIFNKGCYSIPEIVRLIHCNDSRPENKNIYIKNFKDEYMFTFDGKDWDIEKKDVVFSNMIENKKNLLESKFDDMQNELPQYAISMFKKFLERSDNDEVIVNIKDELKNMFYKNRNHVIKNIKTIKNDTSVPALVTPLSIVNIEKKPKKKMNNTKL